MLTAVLMVSVTTLVVLGAPSEHFLEYSEDNFKAQFISGNLTASVTDDWPRVDFQHSENLLAPMFEIGVTRLFLFNDTNGDSVFSRSEAVYTGFLDADYVEWNKTAITFGTRGDGSECASVSMSTTVSLYSGYVDDSEDGPDVPDWANLTFRFMICENSVQYSNSLGQYVVAGKTDLHIQMSIEILKQTGVSRLALEQILLAGGSVHLFLLKERAAKSDASVLTSVSCRDDERGKGLNFTNRMHQTSLPTQDVDFSKADGVVQAYYRFSSEPTTSVDGVLRPVGLNASYYTTGTSLVLCPSYSMDNQTDDLVHDMSIGLEMSGFARVRDWVAENLPVLAIISGGLIVLAVASIQVWRRKHRRTLEDSQNLENGGGDQPRS